MDNFLRRIAEKLYFKCYPERAHDHELAIMPIPIVREERYKPIKLIVLEEIPEDINFSEAEIRDILSRKLAAKIADLMKLERVEANILLSTLFLCTVV